MLISNQDDSGEEDISYDFSFSNNIGTSNNNLPVISEGPLNSSSNPED